MLMLKNTSNLLVALTLSALTIGCTTKTMSITSEPGGAKCFVNDSYKGTTPLRFNYHPNGRYHFRLTKADHQTLTRHIDLKSKLYQIPPFDIGAEFLTSRDINDVRELHFKLKPFELESEEAVIGKAKAMKTQYHKIKNNN